MMPALFTPFKIKSIVLKNRIVVSPMCQYSSTDGFANNWHLVHLGSMATGGAALVMTEATAVSAEGRISAADLGIYKEAHIEKLKEITAFIKERNAVPGIQLAHAGRKASHRPPWAGGDQALPSENDGWVTVGPSAIPFREDEEPPVSLDQEGIHQIKTDFKIAASRALKAGFQVIEIHGAHGYLIHQFLSPKSNTRTDQYGGSFDNRVRLLLEIIDEIQLVWPSELPLFVRLSATEWIQDGWNIDDSVKLSILLKQKEVDLVDCSTGGNINGAKIQLSPGYQVPFASQIRGEAGIATGAVGLITEAQQANEIINSGEADLVFMAREILRDPRFPLRAAHELEYEMEWPVQYERAKWRK